ncbi:AraC family transcriptional regulator [Acidovorax cavernicola]|uniref:AraC family transcriptional regulator n=1 Tax=Acidovorax cavernicola TaxID=1675792 RepID=A0A9X8GWU6_9BURK|nr:AraC family transcriptional regulator [Acidovorax cavernicola]RIX84040.1 AraC family transcriptional regulator [Acidovorax cavernicola]
MPERQSAKPPEAGREADVFFEVFEAARVRGGKVHRASLTPGQALRFVPPSACFHFVEGASCVLHAGRGTAKTELHPGDLVILARGRPHTLELAKGAAGAASLTTGEFSLMGATGKLLTDALPALLHVKVGQLPQALPESSKQWIAVTLAAIRLEAEHPSLGSGVMLSRLVDLLFVWSLRHWLATAPAAREGWFAALGDAVVGRALALMHAHPARAWSVEMLARDLNQSRSGFSQRFVDKVGEPPMRYLTHWRMQLASDLLTSSTLRVSQVAQRVGYDSEPAFSRAFRRHAGMAPVDYRKQRRPS